MAFLIVVGLIIFWLVATYNSLIRHRNMVREAWSGIDVQLKRRSELIPNLVETVKGYSRHEQQLFENIVDTRSKSIQAGLIPEKLTTENQLTGMIKHLFAIAESYPELKANQNFLELQRQLVEIEDQLQYARRYYNGTVRDYNIQIESFPSNLAAKTFGFKKEDYFELTLVTERETPEVKL